MELHDTIRDSLGRRYMGLPLSNLDDQDEILWAVQNYHNGQLVVVWTFEHGARNRRRNKKTKKSEAYVKTQLSNVKIKPRSRLASRP